LLFQKRGGSTIAGQIVAAIIVSNNPHCGMSSVEIRNGESFMAAEQAAGREVRQRHQKQSEPGNQKVRKEKSGNKSAGNKKARHSRAFDECLFRSAHLFV
jgi:hypothetical protein